MSDAEPSEHDGIAARGLVSGFAELTLESQDFEALERFYTETLALPVIAREHDRVWLGVGPNARLGLWTPGRKEFGDRGGVHVHFALSTGRLDELALRLDRRGIETEGPVEHEGGDRSLYFRDPAGNLVEVWNFFERAGGRNDVSDLAA